MGVDANGQACAVHSSHVTCFSPKVVKGRHLLVVPRKMDLEFKECSYAAPDGSLEVMLLVTKQMFDLGLRKVQLVQRSG